MVSSHDAPIADLGLDGVIEAAVGIALLRLENDEGLKGCWLAAYRAGATEDERIKPCFARV